MKTHEEVGPPQRQGAVAKDEDGDDAERREWGADLLHCKFPFRPESRCVVEWTFSKTLVSKVLWWWRVMSLPLQLLVRNRRR